MKRSAALLALLAAGCASIEPKYARPAPAIPPSWPAGDAYVRQSEAMLPALTYKDIFRDVRLQTLIAQALAKIESGGRGGQHRCRARTISN